MFVLFLFLTFRVLIIVIKCRLSNEIEERHYLLYVCTHQRKRTRCILILVHYYQSVGKERDVPSTRATIET